MRTTQSSTTPTRAPDTVGLAAEVTHLLHPLTHLGLATTGLAVVVSIDAAGVAHQRGGCVRWSQVGPVRERAVTAHDLSEGAVPGCLDCGAVGICSSSTWLDSGVVQEGLARDICTLSSALRTVEGQGRAGEAVEEVLTAVGVLEDVAEKHREHARTLTGLSARAHEQMSALADSEARQARQRLRAPWAREEVSRAVLDQLQRDLGIVSECDPSALLDPTPVLACASASLRGRLAQRVVLTHQISGDSEAWVCEVSRTLADHLVRVGGREVLVQTVAHPGDAAVVALAAGLWDPHGATATASLAAVVTTAGEILTQGALD